MSEKSTLISGENLPTIAVVAFVLALLSLAMNYYNYTRIDQVVAGQLEITEKTVDRVRNNAKNYPTEKLTALEARIADLEGKLKEQQAKEEAPAEGEPATP
jgi:hypothetical protein